MKRLLLCGVLLGLLAWASPPPVQANCVVTGTETFPAGTYIPDDKCDNTGAKKTTSTGGTISSLGTNTAAAPVLGEGSSGSFSFDLAGNARFTMGTLLEGEDQNNHLLNIGFGATRITTFPSVITTTTSATQTLFTGPVRFMAQITNATSETKAATLDIYGNWTNSTTGGIKICTITLPSTVTVTHLEDICPIVTPIFSFYYYTSTIYTSGSSAPLTLYGMQ